MRERLLARRYGPGGGRRRPELAAEAHEVVRRLGGSVREARPGRRCSLLLVLAGSTALRAQNPAPEQLYESGALHAAAEAFARRAAAEPAVAGALVQPRRRLLPPGARGRAEAAWLQARRLDPRDPSVRRALELTPPADVGVGTLGLVAAGHAGGAAAAGCRRPGSPAGWDGSLRPRARERWLVLLVFAGAAVLGRARPPHRGTAGRSPSCSSDATLRLSPHGRAPAVAPVEGGSAVRIVRTAPGMGPGTDRGRAARGGCRTRRWPRSAARFSP